MALTAHHNSKMVWALAAKPPSPYTLLMIMKEALLALAVYNVEGQFFPVLTRLAGRLERPFLLLRISLELIGDSFMQVRVRPAGFKVPGFQECDLSSLQCLSKLRQNCHARSKFNLRDLRRANNIIWISTTRRH